MTDKIKKCASFAEYVPGKSVDEVKRKYGLEKVVKLASNENPYGPSPKAIEAIKNFKDLHVYPNPDYNSLREAISEFTGWETRRIVVGAGIDGILETIFRLVFEPGDEVVIPIPTFPYYHILAKSNCVREVLVRRNEWFESDERVLDAIGDKTKLVIFCNPNNPTGNLESEEIIKSVIESSNCLVFIDEAYIEFSDLRYDFDGENVIVARTFSKAFGLANLRVGYARLPDWMVEYYRKASTPFPISTLAEIAAIEALRDVDWLEFCLERIKRERGRVYREIKKLAKVYPSQANFIFFDSPIENLSDELLVRGVIVRDCKGFVGCGNQIRVSIGRKEENDFFIETLKEVLK
ncbi:histidinol-phosphate transaminase [Archaeoglobales archaeon ex4484_92]|nr:MAG: histidinol-phosphate transaminase [Archaeoglobales archaeon ex4484_92]